MALLLAARTAGKHAAKAYESRTQSKAFEAQAIQNPETADAQARVEEARTQKTAIRAKYGLAAGVLAIGAVGFAAYEVKSTIGGALGAIGKGVHELIDGTRASMPKPALAVQMQNALKTVTLPAKPIVVEGDGTGSVSLHSKSGSTAPLGAGWVYNNTIGRDTDRTAYALRDGKAQILVAGSAIKLSATHENHMWSAQADVNISGISNQRADMHYALDDEGNQRVHASADFLARATSSSSTGDAVRDVTSWADNSFENRCSPVLLTALGAGVQNLVQNEITSTAGLEASMGDTKNARLLRRIGKQPVNVVFYRENYDVHGNPHRQNVTPTSIEFPLAYVPSSHDNTTVQTGGDCVAYPVAVNQLLEYQQLEARG